MDVLITGAAGTVGTAITDHLSDDTYDFTLLDVVETDGPGESVVADVRDYEVIRPSFDEQEAIVHLALIQDDDEFTHTSREVGWSATL